MDSPEGIRVKTEPQWWGTPCNAGLPLWVTPKKTYNTHKVHHKLINRLHPRDTGLLLQIAGLLNSEDTFQTEIKCRVKETSYWAQKLRFLI
jgi:hypothetical protein